MKLRVLAAAALLALAAASAPARAGADVTLRLPPPDPSRLVPLAAMPLDKPPVPLPAVGAPSVPQGLPELRPARLASDVAQRPVGISTTGIRPFSNVSKRGSARAGSL